MSNGWEIIMRTIKGAARNKAKRRLFRKVKGYRGGRNNLLRTAKETLIRAEAYAFRDRRARKRQFRRLWIIRINAAVSERGMRYSEFMHGLSKATYLCCVPRSNPSHIAVCSMGITASSVSYTHLTLPTSDLV